MKKFLAVIMTIVMAFSLVVVPASAVDVTVDDVFTAIETSMALIEDTFNQIHNIVGTILGVLGKECPLCAVVHEVSLEDAEEESVTEPVQFA